MVSGVRTLIITRYKIICYVLSSSNIAGRNQQDLRRKSFRTFGLDCTSLIEVKESAVLKVQLIYTQIQVSANFPFK